MEALEFLKERKRMCRSFGGSCTGCPCEKVRCVINAHVSDDDYKRIVAMVEEWSAAHPRKTRQSVFLEQYPEARIDKTTGVLTICPAELTKECRDDRGACGAYSIEACVCEPCRREFWMQEVE